MKVLICRIKPSDFLCTAWENILTVSRRYAFDVGQEREDKTTATVA